MKFAGERVVKKLEVEMEKFGEVEKEASSETDEEEVNEKEIAN